MKTRRRAIESLEAHSEPYVTVRELAEYWSVSTKQIYKQIDAGMLSYLRIGPRLLRIRTDDAKAFERRAKMDPQSAAKQSVGLGRNSRYTVPHGYANSAARKFS